MLIGIHYPEFSYEREQDRLKQAIIDLELPYAVFLDNEGDNWRALNNRYWRTIFLMAKEGRLRYIYIGNGRYPEMEAALQEFLSERAL